MPTIAGWAVSLQTGIYTYMGLVPLRVRSLKLLSCLVLLPAGASTAPPFVKARQAPPPTDPSSP